MDINTLKWRLKVALRILKGEVEQATPVSSNGRLFLVEGTSVDYMPWDVLVIHGIQHNIRIEPVHGPPPPPEGCYKPDKIKAR